MMTTVYRFECASCKRGPYRCFCADSDRLQDTLGARHTGSPAHPLACHHVSYRLWAGFLSGMEDLDALLEWFDDLIPELHEAGMVLAWYEIDVEYVVPICTCAYATPHVLMAPDREKSRDTMTIEG